METHTRRELRQLRKEKTRTRNTRTAMLTAAFGLVATLVIGGAAGAYASDAPPEGEGVDVSQVEVALNEDESTEDTSAPEQTAAQQPATDETTEQASAEEPAAQPEQVIAAEQSVADTNAATKAEEKVDTTTLGGDTSQPNKVFVCKYVGTPGTDERLQTGQNPISVSINAIQNNQWNGTVPGWFSDAHDRSYVLDYDRGQPEPSVSLCPEPEGPPEPVCVQKPNLSYTYDGVGSGTVTSSAEGAKQGDALCDPLAVRPTTWVYVLPASGNPSWPQTLVGYNDVLVDKIGTFSYAAPELEKCRQHDIYAQFVSKGGFGALAVPNQLNGPNNPFEPPFLHQTLAGKGPNPTYNSTSSDGCNTPPTTPEPRVEYSNWQDEAWECGDTEVTQTRTKTVTPFKVVLQDGKWVTIEDTANIVVTPETQTRPLTEAEIESCKPEIPEPKVESTPWEDGEWECGDTTVEQTRLTTTTAYMAVLVSGSTWEIVVDEENSGALLDTQTRNLTEDEITECPTTTTNNPPTKVPSSGVIPPPPGAETGKIEGQFMTASADPWVVGGGAALLALALVLALWGYRRQTAQL